MAENGFMNGGEVVEHSLLSDKAILRHMENGTVVIKPFIRDQLSTSRFVATPTAATTTATTIKYESLNVE